MSLAHVTGACFPHVRLRRAQRPRRTPPPPPHTHTHPPCAPPHFQAALVSQAQSSGCSALARGSLLKAINVCDKHLCGQLTSSSRSAAKGAASLKEEVKAALLQQPSRPARRSAAVQPRPADRTPASTDTGRSDDARPSTSHSSKVRAEAGSWTCHPGSTRHPAGCRPTLQGSIDYTMPLVMMERVAALRDNQFTRMTKQQVRCWQLLGLVAAAGPARGGAHSCCWGCTRRGRCLVLACIATRRPAAAQVAEGTCVGCRTKWRKQTSRQRSSSGPGTAQIPGKCWTIRWQGSWPNGGRLCGVSGRGGAAGHSRGTQEPGSVWLRHMLQGSGETGAPAGGARPGRGDQAVPGG